MFTNMMKRCAAGPSVSRRDQLIGSGVMLGSCLIFTIVDVLAARRYPDNDLVDAFGTMAFPAALLLSMPFTYISRHSRTTQAILVGGSLVVLAALSVLTAMI